MASIKETFAALERIARPVSIAQIGGFRPPEDPLTSWFLRGVRRADEADVLFNGEPLIPLLQVRVSELTFVPPALEGIALLVVYMNHKVIPYDRAHGDGWMVREYRSLEGLVPCNARLPKGPKALPIKWLGSEPEVPTRDHAQAIIDLDALDDSESASERFDKLPHHEHTKVGGYPSGIQHVVENVDDYVLQIGSERKPPWVWAHDGIATFGRDADGRWSFACQCY